MYWSFKHKNAPAHIGLRVLPTLGMLISAVNERDFKKDLFLLQGEDKWNDLFSFVAPDGNEYRALVKQPNSSIGIELPGDPKAWLDKMMAEGMRQIKSKGKRPFEMLKLEWDGLHAIANLAYGVYPGLDHSYGGPVYGSPVTDHLSSIFLKNFGFGHNGPLYWDKHGGRRDQNSRHDVHVAYALGNNEKIPDDVLSEYKEFVAAKPRRVWGLDCCWAVELLEKPWLRGEFTGDQLRMVQNVLRYKECKIKSIEKENLQAIKEILASLRADFSDLDVVNGFYERGLLPVEPFKASVDHRDSTGKKPLAIKIRDAQIQFSMDLATKRLTAELKKEGISRFEFERRNQLILATPLTQPWEYADRFAEAYHERNKKYLVAVLDTPDDQHYPAKKVLQAETGIKLLRVSAAMRRAAVEQICASQPTPVATGLLSKSV